MCGGVLCCLVARQNPDVEGVLLFGGRDGGGGVVATAFCALVVVCKSGLQQKAAGAACSCRVCVVCCRVAQKHAEWQGSGVDRGKSCLDFLQQMGYREYSRCAQRGVGDTVRVCVGGSSDVQGSSFRRAVVGIFKSGGL